MKNIFKKKKGFTVVEMLIVMAVSSILLTTIGFAIITFQRNFAEKTNRHQTAFYLELIIRRIQLEFPGANTVPFQDSLTLQFSSANSPLPQLDNTFNEASFGTVKHIFVALYDDLFDPVANYDTARYLFVSHVDNSGNLSDVSDLGIKSVDLDIAMTDLVAAVNKMEYIANNIKPPDVILEEAVVTNADNSWY
ncbi:MAG TPA: type II secretion system protein, partial [Firmicutes bacterium]|nr:type II secretion system protein [Bacillota bacterium]